MYNATLVKLEKIADGLWLFFVDLDEPISEFSPGQYTTLGLLGSAPRMDPHMPEDGRIRGDKLIKRAYSIASSPEEQKLLEFYIAIFPEGSLTSRLGLLKEGARLFCGPKVVGHFTLNEVPPEHNLILVSTGTGIAPYISMLRTSSTWTGRKITLVHGARYEPDLAYREELLELQKKEANFRYLSTLSRSDDSWDGYRGYVQEFFTRGDLELDPENDRVFLCGNPDMVEQVEDLLVGTHGFVVHSRKDHGNLHLEKYW